MGKKMGLQSVVMDNPPSLIAGSTIVGPMEGLGPLREYYDSVLPDDLFGEESWEKAEAKMLRENVKSALKKANLTMEQIDIILAGDLLNQLISTNFAVRELDIPFLGLYGACSTMSESLLIAAMLMDGGFANYTVAAVSSHHNTAERQYRFPTEQGVQRPPSSQWTVTGSGASVLGKTGSGPRITCGTIGRVVDLGVKDPNDMGSAMAPAAADTLMAHFRDTGRQPAYYDVILTGDLGLLGHRLVQEMTRDFYDLTKNYGDCGCLVYSEEQDVHAGASGCGCAAVVFNGYLLSMLSAGKYRRVLLAATGALHSPTSYQQKESIPCICHAVAIERD
ncbi:MAG TPA: stage V sporulation protein AD [Negativicutes bacterium]|nr:stage V sporulation protein AD [Negativicutes bacterium]